MGRKKLQRFADLATFPNSFDRDEIGLGGEWIRRHFGSSRPVILELGCGKGEYTLALSRRFPRTPVLGVDRKGDRLWKGASAALESGLENAAFLRADVEDISFFLDPGQVEEIWLPFPDPRPKKRQAKHRMLAPRFLNIYRRILRPAGPVHLKTDDAGLIEYALETVQVEGGRVEHLSRDLHSEERDSHLPAVLTTFERRHLESGRTIKYLRFSFRENGKE